MKRFRTPQEKKVLSYLKDGRNMVSESGGIAHKLIAKRKTLEHQALRRTAKQRLTRALAGESGSTDDVANRAVEIRKRAWRKVPDRALGEFVEVLLDTRAHTGMNRPAKLEALLEEARRKAKRNDPQTWKKGRWTRRGR